MSKKYVVTLTDEEQLTLQTLTRKGKVAARRLTRAHILRMAHAKMADEEIVAALHVGVATVERTRAKFVLGGLDWALRERPRLGAKRKLAGKQEAFLVALAGSEPPTGHHCWTMQMLADKLLELKVAEPPLSAETVRRALKKTNSNPGSVQNGAFPP